MLDMGFEPQIRKIVPSSEDLPPTASRARRRCSSRRPCRTRGRSAWPRYGAPLPSYARVEVDRRVGMARSSTSGDRAAPRARVGRRTRSQGVAARRQTLLAGRSSTAPSARSSSSAAATRSRRARAPQAVAQSPWASAPSRSTGPLAVAARGGARRLPARRRRAPSSSRPTWRRARPRHQADVAHVINYDLPNATSTPTSTASAAPAAPRHRRRRRYLSAWTANRSRVAHEARAAAAMISSAAARFN